MEMTKKSLALIIKATRASIRLADATQKLLHGKCAAWTEADEIAGRLKDALLYLPDKIVANGKTIETCAERNVYIDDLLKSALTDDDAAEILMQTFKQSVPVPMTPAKFGELWQKAGAEIYKMVCVHEKHRGD